MKHRHTLYATLLMASLPFAANAQRIYTEDAKDGFNALYPNAKSLSCQSCHTDVDPDVSGIIDRNSYGTAFEMKHIGTVQSALSVIEPLDSDGDGYTNFTEIAATTASLKAFPGNKTSVPTKALFSDNFSNTTSLALNWTKLAGVWAIAGGSLNVTAAQNSLILAKKPTALGNGTFSAGTLSSKVQLGAASGTPQAVLVFAVKGSGATLSYRYVGLYKDKVTIGEQKGAVNTNLTTATKALGNANNAVRVVIGTSGGVDVYLNAETKPTASAKFTGAVAGKVGLMSGKTAVSFDDFSVSK